MPADPIVSQALALKPRLAVFDCDGTLWANNSGEDFFYWSMRRGMVSAEIERWAKARYEDYRRGGVDESVMCGEMTTMYAGVPVAQLESAAAEFFAAVVKPNYFPEMRRLTLALRDSGCDLWAISSTNSWVVREGVKDFGIAADHVLAGEAECQDGIAGARLLQLPSGEDKAVAIRDVIQKRNGKPAIDAVFGNSVHDAAMLRLARHAFAINPNADLEALAREQRWTIYWPEGVTPGEPASSATVRAARR